MIIGRFAPSPTGPLHFGSLIAATASYLCARCAPDGQWILRIEDVDTQREQQGASAAIINTLEAYGFVWDGEISYQSQRTHHYQAALEALAKHCYPCSCTRKELQAHSQLGTFGYIYPDLCRHSIHNPAATQHGIRVVTDDTPYCFTDHCQTGEFCQQLHREVGDFILKRRDGLFAYQLAVVVDDHLQGITQVVRGADLFDNTPRQLYLQQLLAYARPEYLHFPVATTADGKKLSKQNLSPQVGLDAKRDYLVKALRFLGQAPPAAAEFSSVSELWTWAITHWDANAIPAVASRTINSALELCVNEA